MPRLPDGGYLLDDSDTDLAPYAQKGTSEEGETSDDSEAILDGLYAPLARLTDATLQYEHNMVKRKRLARRRKRRR